MTRQPPRCGTPSGYNRHASHGETACRPCKDAIAAYRREQVAAAMPPERRYTRGQRLRPSEQLP